MNCNCIFNSFQKTKAAENKSDKAKPSINFHPMSPGSNTVKTQHKHKQWGLKRKEGREKKKMAALDSKLVNALNNRYVLKLSKMSDIITGRALKRGKRSDFRLDIPVNTLKFSDSLPHSRKPFNTLPI